MKQKKQKTTRVNKMKQTETRTNTGKRKESTWSKRKNSVIETNENDTNGYQTKEYESTHDNQSQAKRKPNKTK